MSTIEMVTELPGPNARAIIARKRRVVCDPLDLHVETVIDRGLGAMIGVEMVSDRETKEPDVIAEERLDEALDVLADSAIAAGGP